MSKKLVRLLWAVVLFILMVALSTVSYKTVLPIAVIHVEVAGVFGLIAMTSTGLIPGIIVMVLGYVGATMLGGGGIDLALPLVVGALCLLVAARFNVKLDFHMTSPMAISLGLVSGLGVLVGKLLVVMVDAIATNTMSGIWTLETMALPTAVLTGLLYAALVSLGTLIVRSFTEEVIEPKDRNGSTIIDFSPDKKDKQKHDDDKQ